MYHRCVVRYKTITLFKWLNYVNVRFVHAIEYRLQNVEKAVDINAQKIYLF